MRVLFAFLALACIPAALAAQDEAALRRKLERREADLDYIDRKIQSALDHDNPEEAARLNREYHSCRQEVDRLRQQLGEMEATRPERRPEPATPRRVAKPDLYVSVDICAMVIEHGLGLGDSEGANDDGGSGTAGGLAFSIARFDGFCFEYRGLLTEDNPTGLEVNIQEYLIGYTTRRRDETTGLFLTLAGGIINLNAEDGGPSTDSGTVASVKPEFRASLSPTAFITMGVAFDWIWTDFKSDHTHRYSTGTFTVGFEWKF